MNEPAPDGKMLTVKDGWLLCPYCRHRLKEVDPTENADRVKLYCRSRECKRHIYISIRQGRCFESRGRQ